MSTTFDDDLRQFLRPDERSLEFHIVWKSADPGLRASLLQSLKHYSCSCTEDGSDIIGSLEYQVWKRKNTQAVGKVRKLLDRWQERGYLSWTSQRLKPMKVARGTPSRRKPKPKGTPDT